MPANSIPKDTLVCYYREGWRCGYLEEEKGSEAKIRPMPAYKGKQPRSIWIPLKDVKAV